MNPFATQGQTTTSYAQNIGQQPRDPGFLARADQIAESLDQLRQKLLTLGVRLTGDDSKEVAGSGGHPPGIAGAFAAAEDRLRECHNLVEGLHKTF